jgi:molecular chaperone DnaK
MRGKPAQKKTKCSASSPPGCVARPKREIASRSKSTPTVSVSAKDLETGQQQSIQVTATSGLTKDEIKQMIESAKEYMVDRRSSEDFEAAKQEAEKLIVEIERLFPQVEAVVASSDFGREAVNKARRILREARQAIDGRDVAALKGQVEGLARTQRMFKGVVTKTQ